MRRSEGGDNCSSESFSLNKRKRRKTAKQVQGPNSCRSLALSKIRIYGSDQEDSDESLISKIYIVSKNDKDSDVEILDDPDATL